MINSLTEQDADHEIASLLRSSSKETTSEKLRSIYERCGGKEAFQAVTFQTRVSDLRAMLLLSPNFPTDEYLALVEAIPKFTRNDPYVFAYHPEAVASQDIFSRLWTANRDDTLFSIMSREYIISHKDKRLYEHVTVHTIHTEKCLNGKSTNDHHLCRNQRISSGDKQREFFLNFKKEFEASFHPNALAVIRSEILSMKESSRAEYAGSVLVESDHWEALLTDKRSVLNALAGNPLLPEEIAYKIIRSHKTPGLRSSIASNAASKELLDSLWNGTTSQTIRRAVVNNGLSERYPAHGDLLLK